MNARTLARGRQRAGGAWAPVWLLLALLPLRLGALDYHVAPGGSDANSGTAAAPFASLTRARDAVRALKGGGGWPAEGVTIWLRGGTYELSTTVAWDARDSGTAAAPLIVAAWPGEEIRLSGGRRIPSGAFAPVTNAAAAWSRLDPAARGQVYAAELRTLGLTDFGTLRPRGFGLSAAAPLELFCNGRPLTLAQWPNRREPWVRTAAALSATQFAYAGSRPERWSQAGEIWLHGFWKEAWADFHVKVAALDVARKIITLTAPPGTYGIEADRPYIAYNLLEEIDEPGEYFVDRATGILYLWPPAALDGATLQVSLLEGPLLQFAGAQHVTCRDLTIEAGRSGLVRIDSGEQLRFERCQFRNAGQYAAVVAGTGNGLDQCEVVDCGEDGVRLAGGSRATLTSGGNYVTNSRLHRVARLAWTYHPAISISGCGQRATHNLIDDLPHSAILFSGNHHVLEANEIRRVCRITSDAGAIYTGRDWGYRGNVIRGNFLHHIRSAQEGFGAHGVYLDDCVSGIEVSGNVFFQIDDIAIMAGGGRDLVMRGNLIAECGVGHRNDDRGRTRITNLPGDSWNLLARLAAEGIRYQEPPWSTAFPACAAIPNNWEAVQQGLWRNPEGDVFTENLGWANTVWTAESNASGTGVFRVYAALTNNDPAQTPLFTAEAAVDRALRPAVLRGTLAGFAPIAFSAIGRTPAGAAAASVRPVAPELAGRVGAAGEVELEWTDDGNVARTQETGFVVERRNLPAGPWQTLRTFGPDVDFTTASGLAPGTAYAFRVRVINAAGAAESAPVALTTAPAPMVPGTPARVEAEAAIVVVNDPGTLGTVGATNAALDSGQSVRLYDPGDTVRIGFSVASAGTYRIGVRVRSGSGSGPRSYWPGGYRFKLDGEDIALTGDATTVSAQDPSYGVSYWGTMYSGPVTLSAGAHAVEVRSVTSFGVADYLEVAPLSPRPITTFAAWQAAHFAADQRQDPAVSGPSAIPMGDGPPNLLRYALGWDPWRTLAGDLLRVTAAAENVRIAYARPAGLGDVTYFLEGSDDGRVWTALPQAGLTAHGGTEVMQATERAGTAAVGRSYRLRVVREGAVAATAAVAIRAAGAAPRLGNLAVRAPTGALDATLITGFTVAGTGPKPVLTRAIGPGLIAFGVPAPLADPRLEVFRAAAKIAENDNWSAVASDATVLSLAASRVGGFALDAGSRDAAAWLALSPGGYTLQVTGGAGAEGVVLAELYDTDAGEADAPARLSNLSARARAGAGGEVLIVGFTVSGPAPLLLLVRAIGPSLSAFGVAGPLTDPRLEVFQGAAILAANDNWAVQDSGSGAAVVAAAAQAGAFALDAASRDAALLLWLAPGSYTAQVSGLAATSGVALAEVYEVR